MFERSSSPGHLASWAARLFARTIDRQLKPLELSSGHVPVLLALAEEPSLSQRELVERCAIAQPAMVAILKRMEAAGLVARSADPNDGRASIFSLTPASRGKLERLGATLDLGNERALAGFTPDERALVIDLLRRIIRNLSG